MELKLGQRVAFNKITAFEYDPDDFKYGTYKSKQKLNIEPKEGIIVRKTRKATGTYTSSGGGNEDGDFDPPYLSVDKWYVVYEVAYDIKRKSVIVSPEDLEVMK